MNNFFQYFYQDLGRVFRAFIEIFISFFDFLIYLFNFKERFEILKEYSSSFSVGEWVLVVLTEIVVIAIAVILIILIVRFLRKKIRVFVNARNYEKLERQVKELNKDLTRSNFEKDKLLNRLVADLGKPREDIEKEMGLGGYEEEEGEEGAGKLSGNRNTVDSPVVDPDSSRFFRLTSVDNFYKTQYEPPVYDEDITLSQFCDRFRRFSASRLGLYYEPDMMRYFVASMGTARMMILQGISGTGKTSLPYAFGKFVHCDSTVVSVQPAWRERTELYGYYNEFTKKYTETDFLKAIYEANYYEDPHIVILDEMNIARVEYYFAEMLSILEMPLKEEQRVNVVASMWDNDPCLFEDGSIQIAPNVWFVGTINNDDSTFAVADKVYDRAIPIDLDARAQAFACEEADPVYIRAGRLEELFAQAKEQYPLSADMKNRLEILNKYVIDNFRLSFGNRIMKQMGDFIPCFIACGGTEIQAVDFMVAKKVLRKFESLSLGFMKPEITKLQQYLDKQFGKNTMPVCKEYLEYLKKNN